MPEPRDDSAKTGADDVKIVGRIGTDPEELKRWADAVVDRGETIEDMEIEDLRALIEAVQSYPNAKLAPPWKPGDPTLSRENRKELTVLRISGGRVHLKASRTRPEPLAIRVTFHARCLFAGDARFEGAAFAGDARFEGAAFAGDARFERAAFAGNAWFADATFAGDAIFVDATFAGNAWFERAAFAGDAGFADATFAGDTGFVAATFARDARFDGARFAGNASFFGATFFFTRFASATFIGHAEFEGVAFTAEAWFADATFAQGARFDGTAFAGDTWFARATFAGDMWFGGARFEGATFAGRAEFQGARINGACSGDLRLLTVRSAEAALPPIRFQLQKGRWWSLPARVIWSASQWLGSTWPGSGWLGWNKVRALGGLTILNRVSLIALFAIPVIAAAYIALQAIIREHLSRGDVLPLWVDWLTRVVGDNPHLSPTLALTFFAAVGVTLGLLIYQMGAPDAIKKSDEEEFVGRIESRYPEGAAQRDDGLRRAIEKLEDIARRRRNRHPNFVKHHGDLLWIPPRDKIEWFRDETLPTLEQLQAQAEAAFKAAGRKGEAPRGVAPQEREGYLPGAERARICIEEGARAEYWLLSHEKIAWAWASMLCYCAGLGCLLLILVIQCVNVARAAFGLP